MVMTHAQTYLIINANPVIPVSLPVLIGVAPVSRMMPNR